MGEGGSDWGETLKTRLTQFSTISDALERELTQHCPDGQGRLGDFLLAGQEREAQRDARVSLLELTEAVTVMLDIASSVWRDT